VSREVGGVAADCALPPIMGGASSLFRDPAEDEAPPI